MPISAQTPPPEFNAVTSRQQRVAAGVGRDYVDAYNQAEMAKYNNDYNYWLWQQQSQYNSPLEQRKRLEEAGLNPNFNSVESGNLGSLPTSSGSISPSIGRNINASIGNYLEAGNLLLNTFSKGVDMVSKISGIPNDISSYRTYLTENARNIAKLNGWKATGSQIQALDSFVNTAFDALFKGNADVNDVAAFMGNPYEIVLTPGQVKDLVPVDPANSLATQLNESLVGLRGLQGEKIGRSLDQMAQSLERGQWELDTMKVNTGVRWLDQLLQWVFKAIYLANSPKHK